MVLPKKVRKAIEALLGPSGKSDPALRAAGFERTRKSAGEIPAVQPGAFDLRELVEKIAERPWTVSDEDFSNLRRAGYSEDQIFELTVAAAAGAGVRRFEAGLRALEAAGGEEFAKINAERDGDFDAA
jgi:alkylhydroperoxidase family enzyme